MVLALAVNRCGEIAGARVVIDRETAGRGLGRGLGRGALRSLFSLAPIAFSR
jgi:hypothetical protein